MIKLDKTDSIYLLTMDADENRWNTNFVREFSKVLDEIENDEGPGALVTSSNNPKFFLMALILNGHKIQIAILTEAIEMCLVKSSCI